MTRTLTRADIADAIYRELGISHAESSEMVDAMVEEIIKALETEEVVKLSSFGTFSVRSKNARMGRNPKTKEEIPISARKVVGFRASNVLNKLINS